jgi:hypothetical protein
VYQQELSDWYAIPKDERGARPAEPVTSKKVPSMVAPARAEITPIVLGSKWLAHLRAFAGRPILARELSTILRQW